MSKSRSKSKSHRVFQPPKQSKTPEEALASYDRVLAIKPDFARAHYSRGNALCELNRHEEAVASYDRVLAIEPDFARALNNRGVALLELGRYAEAVASYDRALTIKPDFTRALYNRGNALLELNRHEEALASYDRVLSIRPDFDQALNNRGNALFELGHYEDAIASYDRALAIKPDFAQAFYNRGNALLKLRRFAQAVASYDRALAIEPDFANGLNNRGNALCELDRHEEALASYDRVLAIKPDFAGLHYRRGNALFELRCYEQAAEVFERLLDAEPDYDYAKGHLLYSKLRCCDWRNLACNVQLVENEVFAGKRVALPFIFLSLSESSSAQLQCARTYHEDMHTTHEGAIWVGERYRHDRIRLAYLSADFRNHAVAYLIAGLIEAHDKSRFEITAVSFGPDNSDETRTRLTKAFDRFINVHRMSDRDTALLLKRMEIDIAVDLMGYTSGCRPGILAFRPAPIQVNYLGYPGTMGADYIDYIVADRFILPEDHHCFYTEKVVYLPDTYQPNDYKRRISENTRTRVEAGLPETGFVFCSFNNIHKITPPVFDVWMRLLHHIEGSVLWLLEDNAAAVWNLRRNAETRGVASDRLVFAPRTRLEDHLARHRLAGFLLDNVPYNAHTTASDALWAGLPVLTCLGSSFAGRVAGSLLNAVGLPELITDNLEDYEALALKLARDQNLLAAIKAKLAQNRETFPLFDTDRFRRHIESAYETMWERYQRGEPPASFSVEHSHKDSNSQSDRPPLGDPI
jgi:protein O-GlcNAc transferase